MGRNIPASFDAAFEQPNTTAVYMLKMFLEQRTYRFITAGKQETIAGQVWEPEALAIRGPSQKSGAAVTLDFGVPLIPQGQLITDITAIRPQDRRVLLYVTYWYNDAYQTPYTLFEGLTSNVDTLPGKGAKLGAINFSAVNSGNRHSSTPFVRMRPPVLQHMTPKGSIVSWGALKLEIN